MDQNLNVKIPNPCLILSKENNNNNADPDGTKCAGGQQCSEALTDFCELPFFEENILEIFEFHLNMTTKVRPRMHWRRRNRYERKFRLLRSSDKGKFQFKIKKKNYLESVNTGQKPKQEIKIECSSIFSEEDAMNALTMQMGNLEHNSADDPIVCHDKSVHVEDNNTQNADINKSSNENEKSSGEATVEDTSLLEKKNMSKEDYTGLSETNEKEVILTVSVQAEDDGGPQVGTPKHDVIVKSILYVDPESNTVQQAKDESGERPTEEEKNVAADVQENSNVGKRSSRARPNYFVAIPITNDQILDAIEDVQEHIVLKEAKLLRALIPAEKVHITILVAHLQNEEDVKRAVSALMQSKVKVEDLLQGKPLNITFHGIGEFNKQVVYLKIPDNEQELLNRIAVAVLQCFQEIGVDLSGNKDFRPHLTFLKLSKAPSLRRKGFRKICSDLYKEYEDHFFGTELFNRIDLCSMHKKNKVSGYYHCECSIIIDKITTTASEESETVEESNTDSMNVRL
uniref:A-kinase anchor protein 7-like phosphoesterase domain-containing protein n=1 Tax=Leptobrachium leishanense TaxID=445787 RepID=A0A8C5W6L2_9ANUR